MPRPIVHLIPHTHWDREWYLPLGGFRARLVAMVDQLIELLELEPELPGFLLDGQTALLEDYLTLRPEQRERVTNLVRAGRIDTGPWYILADEQIPAGESLLRNLALGHSQSSELGRSLGVIYSPDAFGHPSALPAIGREYGLETAVVWRGVGAEATGARDLCWWEAPDGRRVLLYHLPPEGYEIGSNLLVSPEQLGRAWERVARSVLPLAATRHVAVLVGADHHAADPELATLATRLSVIDRGPEFRLSRLDRFFEEASRELPDLPVIRGELRWSYGYTWTLQGTHATRAPLKRRNSRLEILLTRQAEPLAALASLVSRAGHTPVLRQAWRELVQTHFHDALCGCSDDRVAAAVLVRQDDAESGAGETIRASLNALAGHDPDLAREQVRSSPRLVVWNPAARARGGVVLAEATWFVGDVLVGPPSGRTPRKGRGFAPFVLSEVGSGMVVAPQIISIEPAMERRDAARHYPDQDEVERVRLAFPLPRGLPGMALRQFEPAEGGAEPLEDFAAASGRGVWNGRLALTVERNGTVSLEEPTSGERYAGLLRLESELDTGDCYSFAPVPGSRIKSPTRPIRPRVVAAGPLVSALSWRTRMQCGGPRGRVELEVELEVAGDLPAVRCRLRLDNQARDHRLRLRFPTGLKRVPVLAGAQFGSIEREAVSGGRRGFKQEWPVATAPAHRWVAVARGNRGLAILAPGFFEYECTREGDLLLTLLRSVGELSKPDLASRPGHAGWPAATPMAQCLGQDTLEIGIAPVRSSELAQPDRLERIWEDLFLPPAGSWIREATALPVAPVPSLELEGEGLVLSACLPGAQPGELVVRCFNHLEREVRGAWRLGLPVTGARRIRADGTAIEDLAPTDGKVSFTAGPREIVTLLLHC